MASNLRAAASTLLKETPVLLLRITLAHDGFTERRYQWLATVPRPRSTTVMVRNIPPMYRSDSALKEYFDRAAWTEQEKHCQTP